VRRAATGGEALAILAVVSTVWREADTYRYAATALAVAALIRWFRRDLWTYSKPLIGWVGYLCVGWSFYVFVRLAIVYFGTGQLGTAEGIYMFPLLYATTGFSSCCLSGDRAARSLVHDPRALSSWRRTPAIRTSSMASGRGLAVQQPHSRVGGGWFHLPVHAAVHGIHGPENGPEQLPGTGTWRSSAAVPLFALVNIIALRSKASGLRSRVLILLAVMSLARGHRRELIAGPACWRSWGRRCRHTQHLLVYRR
jgi:hypothetical protein